MTVTSETIQMYRVYIKATPEAVWEAITNPEWTVKYGYATVVECDLRAGGAFRAYANEGMKAFGCPDVISDGEVTRLTVTHDLAGAPMWAAVLRGESEFQGAGGGWSEILSGLKTLMDTQPPKAQS